MPLAGVDWDLMSLHEHGLEKFKEDETYRKVQNFFFYHTCNQICNYKQLT